MPPTPGTSTHSEEVQLRISDYVRPILDRLLLILGVVVFVGVATYEYYDRQPKVYRATTSIYLSSTNLNPLATDTVGVDDRTTLSQATLLATRGVAVRVAERLQYTGDPNVLRKAIVASPSQGSDFIGIAATWGTGQGAADVANAFATEFIRTQSAQQRSGAERLLARLQNQLRAIPSAASNAADRADLAAQIRQLQLSLQLPSNSARQVDSALDPGLPIQPRPKRNAVFAALLALLAAVAMAYGLDRFDRRIRRAEDVADAYGLPMLAVVPHVSQFDVGGRAPAGFVEAFRLLQTNVRLAQVDRPIRVIVVTSAIPGEGKSTVVRYLAEAFSEWGRTVAVIDADLRRPSLSKLYGVSGATGLTDLVGAEGSGSMVTEALVEVGRPGAGGSEDRSGNAEPLMSMAGEQAAGGGIAQMRRARDSTHVLPGSELAAIRVLPAGVAPPNPAALLAAERTRALVNEISATHDIVIIDTPPVLAVSDAMALVPLADAVILVSRVGKTTRDEAEQLVGTLRRIPDAQLTGIVANDAVPTDGDRYGYYNT